MATEPTLKERIDQDGITAEVSGGGLAFPPWTDPQKRLREGQMHGWQVTLQFEGRELTTPFWTGTAIMGAPNAESVLECLLSDAAGLENDPSFEEWAGEMGYDEDSRRAERVYESVVEAAQELEQFLGSKFEDYLWHTKED